MGVNWNSISIYSYFSLILFYILHFFLNSITIRLGNYGILPQLRLEEALFRVSKENWCILSRGTQEPTIVMGISGKPEKLVNIPVAKEMDINVSFDISIYQTFCISE